MTSVTHRIAVIGAGLAGLSCARVLRRAGFYDAPDQFDIRALSAEGYDAPLETNDRRLLSYENASTDIGTVGCTPLLTE